MPLSASFLQFLRALWAQWFSAMSGPWAVPLGIAAVFVENTRARIGLAVTAILCAIFSAYWVWRTERHKVIALTEQLTPKLRCFFDERDSLCDVETHFTQGPKARYFRLRVEVTHGNHVSECAGRMVRIIAPDGVVTRENLRLPFAQAEEPDAISKNIQKDAPEYMDAIAITEDNQVLVPTYQWKVPNSVNWVEMFKDSGDYKLEIAVLSPNAPTARINLLFHWSGDWRTASMAMA
jgi:hypothetical protein